MNLSCIAMTAFSLLIVGNPVTSAAGTIRDLREVDPSDNNRWRNPSTFSGSGTPADIEQLFMTRCERRQCGQNCTNLWRLFHDAFAYKDPCLLKDSYINYCKAAVHPTPKDKTLFWSNTTNQAHEASATCDFTTLEDTLTGYTANKLTWCGQKSTPGINYNSCQGYKECRQIEKFDAVGAFWQQASIVFAEEAVGIVSIMLDGSRDGGAFRDNSIFALYELPNLRTGRVTLVRILLVYTSTRKETCKSGTTLDNLRNKISEHGFQSECMDYTDFVSDRVRRDVDDVTDSNCYCGGSIPIASVLCLILTVLTQLAVSQG
ncbi:ADP-ribosyl cyclase/cyclic ADP-ribose hydrolase-like [Glandiceps talaboti]